MKTRTLRILALAAVPLLLILFVFAALATFDAFSLDGGNPYYSGGNWIWEGDATTTAPEHYVCIGFPTANPPIAPVVCTGNISGTGSQPFLCSVPVASFAGQAGSVDWEIYANNQIDCDGPQVAAPSEDATGTIDPTAVSLTGFSAESSSFNFWAVGVGLLALLGVAVYVVRRIAVYNT